MSAKKVINLLILDESGSMESIKSATINGFNEVMQGIRSAAKSNPLLEQFIQFNSFNGNGLKEILPLQTAAGQHLLTNDNYQPDSMTPLYDAIGHSVNRLRYAMEKEGDYAVLVTILTDGDENASQEFTGPSVTQLVKKMEKKGWTFTYMGANQDVQKVATSISIQNYACFEASPEGIGNMLKKENKARAAFYDRLASGSTAPAPYFAPEENL